MLSTLGPTENVPDYQVTCGTGHIVRAMEAHGVDRLVVTAGAGVAYERDRPGIPNRIIRALLLVFARHVYEDMRRAVEVVRASNLAWTVVRVPMLVDGPPGDEIRVGYVGMGTGARIVRADIARFMLDELERGNHIHDAPAISN